jgi:hypothetical protein
MSITSTALPHRWARIPGAVQYSGLGRSHLNEIAQQHPGLFKKSGACTIVDLVMLDQILADLPPAEIAPRTRGMLPKTKPSTSV